MAKLSISEAIRQSGVSRTTFYNRYISKGLISVSVEKGKKHIDSSELLRVFGEMKGGTTPDSPKNTESIQPTQVRSTEVDTEIRLLKEALDCALKDKEWLKQQNEDLSKKNDSLTRRLLPEPENKPNRLVRWWRGL